MECASCKSKKFYKNDSGYYICLVCYCQYNAPILKHETFSTTPRSLKRKLSMKHKFKEHQINTLTWTEYKSYYLALITHCISSLCLSQNLKQELIPCSKSLFDLFIPEVHPEVVLPKNRRKRLKSNLNKYPKNNFSFIKKLQTTYGDLSDKNLNKLLKPLIAENPKKLKRSDKLLKLYRTVDSEVELTCSEVPIELGLVLMIIYIAILYTYSDVRGILVGDIIEWCYTGCLPYLKGYKKLDLPKSFKSLFRPLSIPSAGWLRKKVAGVRIETLKGFRTFFPFISNLFTTICNKLNLDPSIGELGYKLYARTVECSVCEVNSNALPETVVASHVIIALKLVYGLNDSCYLIDLQKSKQKLVKNQVKVDVCEESGPYWLVNKLPSVTALFENWLGLIKKVPVANQYYNVTGLEEVLRFVEENGEQEADSGLIIEENFDAKLENGLKVQQKLLIRNHDIVSDLQYYKSKGKLKLPAQDYWVQQKRKKNKDYPFDYLFTLHCICALCGDLNPTEVNFICDRLDRFIKKNS